MCKIKAQNYNLSNVKGITLKQLTEHYKLYKGYVDKINEMWSIPNNSDMFPNSNSTYSKMRCLKRGESYALDGVKLHELYFNNITSGSTPICGKLLDKILKEFNSLDNFLKYFKEVGLSVRGWAILCIDPLDNKLHIFGSDTHDNGAIWLSYPLLIMDVYEHAYFLDFGTDKSKYIDVFFKNVNWNIVNNRLKKYYNLMSLKNCNMRSYPNMPCPYFNNFF
ncbi:superoxide dismutase [Clostridium niameyense]|nr:superoxide dismutase [Clostridium niameyense]